MTAAASDLRILEIRDERTRLAASALALIAGTFTGRERQPVEELRSEVAEKRLALLAPSDFHMIAAVDDEGGVAGVATGVYLSLINAGFVSYLAVAEPYRGQQLARRVRMRLVQALREDGLRYAAEELAFVLGEVRPDNPWLRALVRRGGAVPFDLDYYHPGMRLGEDAPYVLYRQPLRDVRLTLPSDEVLRILFQIWRRGYRVRYPLLRDTFLVMLESVRARPGVGVHAGFERVAGAGG
jgi:GNAT superfamily N-acetyltransferase